MSAVLAVQGEGVLWRRRSELTRVTLARALISVIHAHCARAHQHQKPPSRAGNMTSGR